ncbi:MAG: glycosyltransferase family 4 protein [Solirubrobacteraceae bacterium]
MNVLYVCADRGIPVLGNKGASVHLRSLTSAMQSLGHRVTVLARRWDEGNEPPRVDALERLAKDGDAATAQLDRVIRSGRADVVIERYSLQSGAARAATSHRNLPLTLEVNAPLVHEAVRFRGLDDPDALGREHQTLQGADRLHVVSSSLERYVREIAPRVPVALIPNGAEVGRFRSAAVADVAGLDGRTVIGFVGSMKPWHGVEQLLEAFACVHLEHPHAALLLVGAGPLESALRERASQPDLRGSVFFTGPVLHAEIPSLMARVDIAVAPYLPLDGFYFHPLKVVEYLAAGKPVIYADQGDLRELVGCAGFGYEPGSVDGLANRLTALVADPRARRELAARATERGATLDWTAVAARVLAFATAAPDRVPLDAEPATIGYQR